MGWVVPWRRGWLVQSKEAERLHEEKVGKRETTADKVRDGQGEASAQRSGHVRLAAMPGDGQNR